MTTDKQKTALIIGATGGVGGEAARALLKRGWRVRAAVRRPDLAGHLQPLGMVGWVQPVQANLDAAGAAFQRVPGVGAQIHQHLVNLGSIRKHSHPFGFDLVSQFDRGWERRPDELHHLADDIVQHNGLALVL